MLSAKAKYGLKAMLHLAEREGQGGVQGADIAATQTIPKKFLDAILLELKNQGLLYSKKGKGGGYTLARPAARITAGQIIRILDGPLAPIPCVSVSSYRPCTDCADEAACQIRRVMQKVRDATAEILDNTTLKEMMGERKAPLIMNYDI
ncbi:HTH-type transcriptional regulator CymR [mine drainage metagenome]|uniref:HTH-type transcriptional regulator CymR n=1 Tax=mine drainage metagenome TaxID=410659 RepID=A0A1J5RM18_9ZZZZ